MTFRRALVAVIVTGLGASFGPLRAADPPKPAGDKKTPPPAAEAPKKKESFFGKKLALYLETRGGPAGFAEINSLIAITGDRNSDNHLQLESGKSGQFTVGWTLPRDRGQYLFTYNGIVDGSYQLDATGSERSYLLPDGTTGKLTASGVLPWWSLHVADGKLHSVETPPVWDINVDDTNHNGIPDPSEVKYPTTAFDATRGVASSLNNHLQTYDLYYRREFGGVRYRARWTVGGRYLAYDGTLPTPTWLKSQVGVPGIGYSDGFQNLYLMLSQKTRGWGPTGSAEMQFNFARRRFQIYMMAQFAFILESLDSDSGPFTYLAPSAEGQTDLFPGQGQITHSVSKSAWNTTFEAGFRVRILEGFHAYLAWNRTGYLDTVLVPTTLSVPQNDSQVDQGVAAVFTTRDIVVTTTTIGLSFQF